MALLGRIFGRAPDADSEEKDQAPLHICLQPAQDEAEKDDAPNLQAVAVDGAGKEIEGNIAGKELEIDSHDPLQAVADGDGEEKEIGKEEIDNTGKELEIDSHDPLQAVAVAGKEEKEIGKELNKDDSQDPIADGDIGKEEKEIAEPEIDNIPEKELEIDDSQDPATDEDDKPLVTKKDPKAVDPTAKDAEPSETKGVAPVQFSKGLRKMYLRVSSVEQAIAIIVARSSFGLKKVDPQRIQITCEGAVVDGDINAGHEYEVVLGKAKPKAKSKATAKTAAKSKGKDEQEDPAKAKPGRKFLDVPLCVTDGEITTETQDHEVALYIGRLYKQKSNPDAAEEITKARNLRKAFAAGIGAPLLIESTANDLQDLNKCLERAARLGAKATTRVSLLGEAFPPPPVKRARGSADEA